MSLSKAVEILEYYNTCSHDYFFSETDMPTELEEAIEVVIAHYKEQKKP